MSDLIVGVSFNDFIITNRNLKKSKDIVITDMLMSYYTAWDILRYENIESSEVVGIDIDCLKLTFNNGKQITISPYCLVYTRNRDFVKASELTKEDYVVYFYSTPYSNIERGRTKETFLVKCEEVKADICKIIGTVNNDMFLNGILVRCEEVEVRYPIRVDDENDDTE